MDNNLLLVASEIRKLLENKNEYPKCELYHYTDMAGLEGILSTRRLWMTHYTSLLDKEEIKHAHKKILEIIQSHKENSIHKEFWNLYYRKSQTLFEMGDYFICSFTKSDNNKKLWEEYAKKGGVAIKFRKEYFLTTQIMNKKKRRYNLTTVQYIQYQTESFTKKVTQLISVVENFIDIKNHQLAIELASHLTTYFLTEMPKIKENRFLEEQECRLYQYGFNTLMNKKGDKNDKIYAIPQVLRNNKLVLLRKFKQTDICEIIVDLSCDKEKIKSLLHKYQFSGVSIRSRK